MHSSSSAECPTCTWLMWEPSLRMSSSQPGASQHPSIARHSRFRSSLRKLVAAPPAAATQLNFEPGSIRGIKPCYLALYLLAVSLVTQTHMYHATDNLAPVSQTQTCVQKSSRADRGWSASFILAIVAM